MRIDLGKKLFAVVVTDIWLGLLDCLGKLVQVFMEGLSGIYYFDV